MEEMGNWVPVPAPASWGLPFTCTFASSPSTVHFLSPHFHSHSPPPESRHISVRKVLYICLATLYLMPFNYSRSLCDSVFSLSLCPSLLLLSISPPFCLFLQALQSYPATVNLLQKHTGKMEYSIKQDSQREKSKTD